MSITISKVASVHIKTGMVWSEILIESSGGTDAMKSHGHTKADAQRIKALIEDALRRSWRSNAKIRPNLFRHPACHICGFPARSSRPQPRPGLFQSLQIPPKIQVLSIARPFRTQTLLTHWRFR